MATHHRSRLHIGRFSIRLHSKLLLTTIALLLIIATSTPTLAVPISAPAKSAPATTADDPNVCAPALTRGVIAKSPAPVPAAGGSGGGGTPEPQTDAPAILTSEGCTLAATLIDSTKGGAPNGWGLAVLRLDLDKKKLCYAIHVSGIALPMTAAHVHFGNGSVAIDLQIKQGSSADGCVDAEPALMQQILNNPGSYFVNIHNDPFPSGILSGRLRGAIMLEGAIEVAPGGDPKGWGAASFNIDVDGGKLCYEVGVANVTLPGTANHIHKAKAGTAGPTVLDMTPPDANGYIASCADLDPTLLRNMLDDPTGYYINVHNADYPKSALRGQFPHAPNLGLCAPALTRGGPKSQPPAPAKLNQIPAAEKPAEAAPAILTSGGCTLAATLIPVSANAPNGWGLAVLQFALEKGQICYAVHVTGVKLPILAMHIHWTNGQLALPVSNKTSTVDGCVNAGSTIMSQILNSPRSFYFNVHNVDNPDGVVGGPLRGAVLLQGAIEVPPGDSKGWGAASFSMDVDHGRVCYEVGVANITLPATADHIHKAKAGAAGPTVVDITPPDGNGYATGCSDGDAALIQSILDDPTGYYINVHNADFPKSALRGQFPVN